MTTINEALQAGLELHRAGKLDEAESIYHQVLEKAPRHAPSHHLAGLMAFHRGKLDQAAQHLQDAAKLDPFTAMYWVDLGEVHRAAGKIREAIAAYQQAIKLNPDSGETQTNYGTLLEAAGDLDGAIACFLESTDRDPKYPAAYRRLAIAMLISGRCDEAGPALSRAGQFEHQDAQSLFDFAYCLHVQGRLPEAISLYRKSIQMRPDSGEAHYHLGMAMLAGGDFSGGWPEYEWRLQPQLRERLNTPQWNGAELAGQSILVHSKWPLGDTIQFLRYVPLVQQRGGNVTLEVPAELVPLARAAGHTQVIAAGTAEPSHTAQVSLVSLPRVFATTLETLPRQIPYLAADEALVEEWGKRLADLTGFRVGIVWQGDPAARLDPMRSIPLKEFLPLARQPGVQLISLQKKDGLAQLSALGPQPPVVDLGAQLDEAHGPLMDTAAVMKNLDLVITCDTAAAHLAGALGVKVWVALPTVADCRWMLEREDSPWYPTMRLFRQSRRGDWSELFGRIAAQLPAAIAQRASG